MTTAAHESNLIAGHAVEFPRKPYGVQLSFCAKTLQALSSQSNALLEAPTGSGKTLSLLCSALAWQYKLKLEGYTEAWEKKGQAEPAITIADPENEEEAELLAAIKRAKRVPKIFYATRTHSQIAQVIRELKRTHYRPKMAILAAREHYCVNKQVASKPNLEEECDKLLSNDGPSCAYYSNVSKLFGTQASSTLKVHDIEDLAKAGKHHRACPYFASRHFAAEADLIFCPYSYLLDPAVRSAMDVDISNAVLIFDEAHNIEDVCREAGSAEIDLRTLEDVLTNFQALDDAGIEPELYGGLGDAVRQLVRWLRMLSSSSRLKNTEGHHHELVLAGNEAAEELREAGLNEEQVELLWDLYLRARAQEDRAGGKAGDNSGGPRLGGLSLGIISRLLITLHLMYRSPTRGCKDYRLAVQKGMAAAPAAGQRGRGRSKHRGGGTGNDAPEWKVQMCLWALNPAVAFAAVAAQARSIILTSGTLSPLESFDSELGIEFAVRFEGSHVVNLQEQVWVAALPRPHGGQPLTVTYQSTGNTAVQDAIGHCVLKAARIVPGGMLVFLSSYSLLDRLSQRWQATAIWKELASLKRIVCEPRGTGDAFDGVMRDYYGAIETGRGAIMFAIFRGKVSEGLDFTDDNARAVICVGVPLPSWKDAKVQLKKQYNNDIARSNPAVLSGEAWYTQQAFRALNQAVGRCIRHRGDYGAIMLIDERYQQARYQKPLSRWVRSTMRIQQDPVAAMSELQAFFTRLHGKGQAEAEAHQEQIELVDQEPAAVHAAAPTAEELKSKQQSTLHSAWQKPQRLNPLLHPSGAPFPAYLTPLGKHSHPASAMAKPAHKAHGSAPDRLQKGHLPLQRSADSPGMPASQPGQASIPIVQQPAPGLPPVPPAAAAALMPPTQTHGRGAEGAWPVLTAHHSQQMLSSPQPAQPAHGHMAQQLSRFSAGDAAHAHVSNSRAPHPALPAAQAATSAAASMQAHQQHQQHLLCHQQEQPTVPSGSSGPSRSHAMHAPAGRTSHAQAPSGKQHAGFRRLSDIMTGSSDIPEQPTPGFDRTLQQWQLGQLPLAVSPYSAPSLQQPLGHDLQQHVQPVSGSVSRLGQPHTSSKPDQQQHHGARDTHSRAHSVHAHSTADKGSQLAVDGQERSEGCCYSSPAPSLRQLLTDSLISEWLKADLAIYKRYLGEDKRIINKEESFLHAKACDSIVECFMMLRDCAADTGSMHAGLAELHAAWCCELPKGLMCLCNALGVVSATSAPLESSLQAEMQTMPAAETVQVLEAVYRSGVGHTAGSPLLGPASPSPCASPDKRVPLTTVSSGSMNSRASGHVPSVCEGSSKAAGVKRGVSNNAAAALVAKHARNNDASTFQKARNDTVSSAIFDDDSDGDDAWPAIL